MDSKQAEINRNVQERLREFEATRDIMAAFLCALAQTAPNRKQLREKFFSMSETHIARWLTQPLPEDWIDRGVAFREVLLKALDHSIPPSP